MNPAVQPLSQLLEPASAGPGECTAIEQFYCVSTVARRLQSSEDTIRRMFRDEPGVIKLGIGKRHEAIRIPESVLKRVLARRAVREMRLEDKRRTPRIGR